MASRGSRGNKSKRTAGYRAMLENTETLCKSQVYNELYAKLKSEGRINRFVATVQYCSQSGLTIEQAVEVLCNSFPGYISSNELTIDCFKDMIKSYSDIAIAWGYGDTGDKISDIIIKNKALSLIEKTDSLEDIRVYKEIFDDKLDNSSDPSNNKSGTVINFNLEKKA